MRLLKPTISVLTCSSSKAAASANCESAPAAYGASLRLDLSRVISAYGPRRKLAAAFGLAHPAQVALDCLHSRKIALRVMQRYLGTYFS
jgi:hypothetical protein